MSDITALGIAIILFIGCIFLGKNDFKVWNNLDMKGKFYLLRAPILIGIGIIIIILKMLGTFGK